MRLSVTALSALLCFGQYVEAYKRPAPAYRVHPDPTEYLDWLPNHQGHGNFQNRNNTVSPWRSHPHHPPHFPRPGQCNFQHSSHASSYWLPKFHGVHQGTSPFAVNGSSYQVYRNVKDFGARGDGVHDDTAAFNAAISNGGRVSGGLGSLGTTGQPALVYVPSGTYLISGTVQLFINTQIIGDALSFPTIKAPSGAANGSVVVSGFDPGQGSTTNFYLGIRNLNIDTTAAATDNTIYALNWAVSQATNLINVNFKLAPNSNHVGIEMDGGSGGGGSGTFMGDLTISGGLIGIQLNNQQYSIKNVKCTNVATCIAIQHCFVVTFQQIDCNNVGACIDLGQEDVAGGVNLIDSWCDGCGVVVNGSSSVVLENVVVTDSGPTVLVNGTAKLSGSLEGKTWALGHVYNDDLTIDNGTFLPYTNRGNLADQTGRYYTKPQPQYANLPVSAFVSVKDCGARSDGQTDDTEALQAVLLTNANCKVTYFPHGVYLVTKTLYVPPGSRIVGEVWSTISASGSFFNDSSSPQPMFQVGKPGEVGTAEITDMLFTVADVLSGTILVQVNMKGANQGDVSFHNSHYRVGGAADSRTETACQTESEPCPAAFLLTHLTESSSTYIENAWLWAADHDLDGTYNQQIGTGRGMLVEATAGTWLVGTGSEHHTLYAYQFNNAQNVFAALLQVETPYWQPTPRAPAPWTPNATWSDPTFDGCDADVSQCYMQWALRIIGADTEKLALYGQGFWVFFNGPNYGACTGPDGACQVNIVDLEDLAKGNSVELYNLNTRGVQNMITIGGSGGEAAATQAENAGSWGGVLAAYLGFE
ncbi:hypothetical protein LTR49_002129 [Elasticomyces elasticus]|nr:hypothetical protein LTR49_002129 [Elasticomyces elasticus]